MEEKSSRTLLLIVTMLVYLVLGAAVFGQLEGKEDNRLRQEIDHISSRLNQKYNFSKSDFSLFELIVIKSQPHKAGLQWNFSGAFYFSTVVITTVGYGHSSPQTTYGKGFCMIFALCGIPMGLIMFQSIGERVNTAIAFCLHKLRNSLYERGFVRIPVISSSHLLCVSLSLGTSIIVLGTYIFHQEEDWTLFDAYYYCFITLSTIGFGDFVPLQQKQFLQIEVIVFTLITCFITRKLLLYQRLRRMQTWKFQSASSERNLEGRNVHIRVINRFMATNADEVTAAEREPVAEIVFEKFPRSNSIVDSQLYGLRSTSVPHRPFPIWSVGRDSISRSQEMKFDDNSGCLSLCPFCRRRKQKKHPFSVRIPPTLDIRHLVRNHHDSS